MGSGTIQKKKCRGWEIGKAVNGICSAVWCQVWFVQMVATSQLFGAGAIEQRGNRQNGTNIKCVCFALKSMGDSKRRKNNKKKKKEKTPLILM